ncbi:MAG: hypothetical protein ACRDQ6_17890, partial [Pseudonocardiaceae bacterium]
MTEQGPAQVSNPQEPYVHSGGKQEPGSGIEMPPYEDRQKTAEDEAEVLKQQQRSGPGTSDAGPRDVSQAEREGVPSTDTTGRSPLGAGQSINKQGNERMVN